ncbi:unnamed protein product [Arabis nemorensis]|uniref:Glabrous enhancer-binding protein-like C-terminal domain-containing protein n=1 Tax=Arabis nemorensis TaxID=586526 RepID=A0A565BIR7_9BRAS|nr:unnamed protein product [Arabis nemorensis]
MGDRTVEEEEKDEVLAYVGESLGKKVVDEDEEVLAYVGEGSGKKLVEEDEEVLAHGGIDSSKKVVEEDKEVVTHNGVDKAVEEKDKEVFTHGGGDKAGEEGDKLTNGGGNLGKKAVEEGDKEGLTNGGENLGTKAVEDGDKEGLTHGGGQQSESPCVREIDWFEKSVLVQSMVRFGVEEHYVKERWRSFPAETKKKLEHEWNSLVSKGFQVVSLKSKYMSDLASMFGEFI